MPVSGSGEVEMVVLSGPPPSEVGAREFEQSIVARRAAEEAETRQSSEQVQAQLKIKAKKSASIRLAAGEDAPGATARAESAETLMATVGAAEAEADCPHTGEDAPGATARAESAEILMATVGAAEAEADSPHSDDIASPMKSKARTVD